MVCGVVGWCVVCCDAFVCGGVGMWCDVTSLFSFVCGVLCGVVVCAVWCAGGGFWCVV